MFPAVDSRENAVKRFLLKKKQLEGFGSRLRQSVFTRFTEAAINNSRRYRLVCRMLRGCRLRRRWMLRAPVIYSSLFPLPLISKVGKADPLTSPSSCSAASESCRTKEEGSKKWKGKRFAKAEESAPSVTARLRPVVGHTAGGHAGGHGRLHGGRVQGEIIMERQTGGRTHVWRPSRAHISPVLFQDIIGSVQTFSFMLKGFSVYAPRDWMASVISWSC